ncbi:putative cytochrome b5-like heme/steroid binding domain superfamily [Helianthus annuus]|nr:putative cytochrome b5-like heme/steroid binding domain superfamily [Helianthus annuus]
MTSNTKILSFEEVSKHNRKTDCWLIISGKGPSFRVIPKNSGALYD